MKRISLLILLVLIGCRGKSSPVGPLQTQAVVVATSTPITPAHKFLEDKPGLYTGRVQVIFTPSKPVTLDHYAYSNFGWMNNTSACLLAANEPATILVYFYKASSVSRLGSPCFIQIRDLNDGNSIAVYEEGIMEYGMGNDGGCIWNP